MFGDACYIFRQGHNGRDGRKVLRRTFLVGAGATALTACSEPTRNAVSSVVAERAYPPIGRLVDVDGLVVHATDEGKGPPVVLIHGANVNLRDWTHSLAARLATGHRVVAMDRPGFGHSKRGSDASTPDRQARQLRRAARAMGVRRPVVVGHSWGAMVALAWALDAPDDVAGVVSVSGTTMPWGLGIDIIDALGVGRIGVDWYMASLARRAQDGAIEDFVERAFRPQSPPAGYLDYVGAPLSLRAETLAANGEDLAQTQSALSALSKRYAGLTVPVEILHGEDDWLLDVRRHALAFSERLGDVNVQVAAGVGHMAHHARPDLLHAAIGRLASKA